MAPAKKKQSKKLATSSSNPEPSSSGSADPPVQKKRGRPRKNAIKEDSTGTKPADYKTLGLLGSSSDPAEVIAGSSKRAKVKSEATTTGALVGVVAAELENVNGKISATTTAGSSSQLKKAPGRRRKSEPHRAPGLLIEGLTL